MNPAFRPCINDFPKIKAGKNQNQNWALIGRGSKTSRRRYLFFWKSLASQRSPQGHIFKKIKIKERGVHPIEGFPNASSVPPLYKDRRETERHHRGATIPVGIYSCFKGKRHNRVHPGHFATQQVNLFYPARMSAADWSTLIFTLPRRKIAWVHPTKATFFQNCTLILDMYPVVSENDTLPPAISPAEITLRSHQRAPKYRSSRAKHTTTTDLPPTAATLHIHIDSSRSKHTRMMKW